MQLRRKRLLYLATYRGFKEADLLIGGFVRTNIDNFTEAEIDELEALLTINDREIYDWATEKRAGPPEIVATPLFQRLKAFDIAAAIKAQVDD